MVSFLLDLQVEDKNKKYIVLSVLISMIHANNLINILIYKNKICMQKSHSLCQETENVIQLVRQAQR